MITTNEHQEKIIDLYGSLINPSKARIMRDAGLGIVEAKREGAYVWDQTGTRYIDCRDDAGVYNVGRRNKHVISQLTKALEEYDLGNNLFFSEPRVRLAQKLGAISPGGKLKGIAFGVSGGEIVDFSLKLARAITGRQKIVAMQEGFYGCSGFAVSATSGATYRDPFMPLIPDIVHVPFGDIEALRGAVDDRTACVILEPIQGHAGVQLPPPGYLQSVREICDKTGVLMILDEIQTGLGRTGKLFACDHEGVVPDVMTIGKSLSGGIYPITAAVFRSEYLRFWEEYPFSHLSSFSGSDLGCLTALAAIEYIESNHLPERAAQLEILFAKGFAEIQTKHSKLIKDFRLKGLLMAIEFVNKDIGPQMSRDLSQQGVLAAYTQSNPCQMRILPSLVISEDDAHAILTAFDNALSGFTTVPTLKSSGIDQVINAIQA